MIEELKKIVAEEKNEIRQQYKAQIKAVFGSYARGDFHADSDLDLLIDVDAGATLLDLAGLLSKVWVALYNGNPKFALNL